MIALAPFLPFLPLVTAFVYGHEAWFGPQQFRALKHRLGWPSDAATRPRLAASATPVGPS